MHPCSYSLFTIHTYFCMWYLLKHYPGDNRDTMCRSTAFPSALPWSSNHYTLHSPLNLCLHSHSRVEVFIHPFWLQNDGHPHLSISTSFCTSHFLYFRCVSGFMFCSFWWRLQITKLFTMAMCSNQKTYSSTTYMLSSWSHSWLCHYQPSSQHPYCGAVTYDRGLIASWFVLWDDICGIKCAEASRPACCYTTK